jgi:molybdate transport system regulatory protein
MPDRHPSPSPVDQNPAAARFLTTEQLVRLDQAFVAWGAGARGKRSLMSRNRCRIVFLILRYTGAKLGEVLAVDDREDLNLTSRKLRLGGRGEDPRHWREVHLPQELFAELSQILRDPDYAPLRGSLLALDQGYVRRVLYERAAECGLPRSLANPNTLRRSRGLELSRGGVPLNAIQRLLGHMTANSTAAFLDLPDGETADREQAYLDRENGLTGETRNTFAGRVVAVTPGDHQSLLEVETPGGHRLVSVLANEQMRAMDLGLGSLVKATISAPRLVRDDALRQTADGPNRFRGVVERILTGANTAEVVVLLEDGARVCSVLPPDTLASLNLEVGETVWAMTGAFSISLTAH